MTDENLTRLIERFQRGIWRYLRALGCDTPTADDLCQDTFLEVMQRPFVELEERATAAYLRQVAFHKFISHRRHYDRWVMMDSDVLETFDDCWAEYTTDDTGDEMIKALTECLSQLSNRAQLALKMLYHDRASRDEIAMALGVGPHGAKNILQRAKYKLREMLEERMAAA